jgi:hypothetical protein
MCAVLRFSFLLLPLLRMLLYLFQDDAGVKFVAFKFWERRLHERVRVPALYWANVRLACEKSTDFVHRFAVHLPVRLDAVCEGQCFAIISNAGVHSEVSVPELDIRMRTHTHTRNTRWCSQVSNMWSEEGLVGTYALSALFCRPVCRLCVERTSLVGAAL